MHLSESKTTLLGRRIGLNEEKRKKARAQKVKSGFGSSFAWFRRRGWIVIAILVVIGVLLWENRFYVQRFNPMEFRYLKYIDFDGSDLLTWEDIMQKGHIEYGMPMSEISTDSIEKFLMEDEAVHSVSVRKFFPSSLSVTLKDSWGVAAVYDKGRVSVYSKRGKVLQRSKSSATKLPVVHSNDLGYIKEITAFLTFAYESDMKFFDSISQIGISKEDNAFVVYFRDVMGHALFPMKNYDSDSFVLYAMMKSDFAYDVSCAHELDMRFRNFAVIRNFDKRCTNG